MKFTSLIKTIQQTHIALHLSAVKAVNTHLTVRNWLIGWYIFEYEQKGEDRAKYGKSLLKSIAAKAKIDGLAETNLKIFRQFYLCYPEIGQTLSDQFPQLSISQTLSDQSKKAPLLQNKKKGKEDASILGTLPQEFELTDNVLSKQMLRQIPFSHFAEIIKLKDPLKRHYYEMLVMKQNLSVRELKRQIHSLSYERLGLSANKAKALAKIEKSIKPRKPEEAVKDFYFFEFLGLPQKNIVEESDLEQALLDHLQPFILELGNGFCFEARQKRILIGDEYFFIDLVFYHRLLRCHVLVELKVDKFNHEHAAQLNTYLNYYNKQVRTKSDNPPIGILLVTDKNKALVEYATGAMDKKMFVSKYAVQLPAKKQLENFLKNELKKL